MIESSHDWARFYIPRGLPATHLIADLLSIMILVSLGDMSLRG